MSNFFDDPLGAVGEAIVQGTDAVANGIESGANAVADFAEEAGNAIGDGADALFGEGSGDTARRVGRAAADVIRKVGSASADGIRTIGQIIGAVLGAEPPPWLLQTHEQSNNEEIPSVPRRYDSGFNISDVSSQSNYTDDGTYYKVRINDLGQIECDAGEGWRVLSPKPEIYDGALEGPVAISYQERRGKGNAEQKNERDFDMYEVPVFEMVAANENRLFAKRKGKDEFYIAPLVRDFVDYRKTPGQTPVNVPAFYVKLDPQCNEPGANDDDLLLINKHHYHTHISVVGFLLYNIILKLLRKIDVQSGVMTVRFEPGIWHFLDSRPPRGSGAVPQGVESYKHVTYGWTLPLLGTRETDTQSSIRFRKILGMGVGRLHRHTHYDSRHGGELHILAFNMGPIADFASFFDGTCNYYLLCQLKKNDAINEDDVETLKNAYGVLWIDEQTFYSERWRLVHPSDKAWSISRGFVTYAGLRSWEALVRELPFLEREFPWMEGLPWDWEPYRDKTRFKKDFRLKDDKFWCPFTAGYINGRSQLAVSNQTCLVSGRIPKNEESSRLASELNPNEHVLFSLVFSWGSCDRTWRWRKFPSGCQPIEIREDQEEQFHDPERSVAPAVPTEALTMIGTYYPQLISLRSDMTIYFRGTKKIDGNYEDGYWVQKYLPADNWERPFLDENAEGSDKEKQLGNLYPKNQMPLEGFDHDWHFVLRSNFVRADRFSHFGNYGAVDFRSQYYEISVASDSQITAEELVAGDENLRWIDQNNQIAVFHPRIDYSELEDLVDSVLDRFDQGPLLRLDLPGLPPVVIRFLSVLNRLISGDEPLSLFKTVHQPPSLFNDQIIFKIVNRPRRETPDQPRLIAMLWDKRDDDLTKLYPNPPAETITLTTPDGAKKLKIRLQERQVLWKSPVVQKAALSVDSANRSILLRFSSRIEREPRYLRHWKRIEDYMGMGVDLFTGWVKEKLGLNPNDPLDSDLLGNWVKILNPPEPPDIVPHDIDHDPSSVDPHMDYPCPDTTIHQVRINTMDNSKERILIQLPITVFSLEEVDSCSTFSYRWQVADDNTFLDVVKFLVEPGPSVHATYIVFEDLVGHVTTPDSVEFLVGGCKVEPGVRWNQQRQRFLGSLDKDGAIVLVNRSEEARTVQILPQAAVAGENDDSRGQTMDLTPNQEIRILAADHHKAEGIDIEILAANPDSPTPLARLFFRLR